MPVATDKMREVYIKAATRCVDHLANLVDFFKPESEIERLFL